MKDASVELTDCVLVPGRGKQRFEYQIIWRATGEEVGYADGLREAVRMVETYRRLVKEGKNGLRAVPKRSV